MTDESLAGTVETDATVLLDNDGAAIAAVIDLPAGDDDGDGSSAADDEPSDAVIIASIEADKSVAIAEIHADVEKTAIEANAENKGDLWQELTNLTERVTSLSEQVQLMTLAALSTPQALIADPEPEPEPMTEPMVIITPEMPTEPSSEIGTEPLPESAGANPAPIIEAVTRKIRAI